MKTIWPRIFFAIWVAGICLTVWGSLAPGPKLPETGVNDKVIHLLIYAFLAFIPSFSFRPVRSGLGASLSMIILGVVLEFGQLWTPGRSFEPADMAADTIGVFLGLVLGLFSRKKFPGL